VKVFAEGDPLIDNLITWVFVERGLLLGKIPRCAGQCAGIARGAACHPSRVG